MAARALAEVMQEQGKGAVIGFMPGSASTMEREEGFAEELKKYPKMELVQMAFGMADRAKARAVTENILTAHPDLNESGPGVRGRAERRLSAGHGKDRDDEGRGAPREPCRAGAGDG